MNHIEESAQENPAAPQIGDGHAPVSKAALWTGRVISAVVVIFLLLDGGMKIARADVAVQGTVDMGYPESVVVPIGIALTVSTLLYAIPQTAVLGAILLTGYLGGATASHVRLEETAFYYAIITGVLVWLGLLLREGRLQTLLPWRRRP